MWGISPFPTRNLTEGFEPPGSEEVWDPNQRSSREVIGYHIQASDGELGHVEDFIIDDETWAIRYLVVDTKNWWPGEKVLISPNWVGRVSWEDRIVFIHLSRESVKNSPRYSEDALVTRGYEDKLHRHHNHRGYWVDDPVAKAHSK